MKLIKRGKNISPDINGKLTTVEGETSGSSHAFMNPEDVTLERAVIKDHNGKERETILAIVKRATEFSHYQMKSKDNSLTGEHATMVLNPVCEGAVYEINRQVEVTSETAWNNEIKPVVD